MAGNPVGVDASRVPATSNLSSVEVGGAAVVAGVVSGPNSLGRRLSDLGFLPGTAVRVVRRALLGDPTVYELRGYQLCLRRTEASRIQVVPGDTEGS